MQNNQKQHFVRNLNHLMDGHGTSNYKLAKAINKHQTSIANWRSGLSTPNKEVMLSLADMFGITYEQLIGDELPPIIKDCSISLSRTIKTVEDNLIKILNMEQANSNPTPLSPSKQAFIDEAMSLSDEEINALTETIRAFKKMRGI